MSDSLNEGHRSDNQLFGVGLYLLALVAVVMISMLVKYTSDRVPLVQLLFFRFSICLIPLILIGKLSGSPLKLRTNRYKDHLIRGIAGMCSIGFYFVAVSQIPLAAATAIAYSVPIFCAVLSIPILGELIGLRRWAAVVIGFFGVLIVSWPGSGVLGVGVVAAIGSAVSGALVVIYLRKLSDTEHPLTSSLLYNSLGTVVFLVLCLGLGWTPIQPGDWVWVLAIGGLAGFQQLCFANAFRFAEATFLAPFEYTTLIMAAVGGYLIWREVPGVTTWVGGAIIILSGLFMLYRRRRVESPERVTPRV
ncbi:MAG: DMT family transporter [Acidiferrobacterales bacterium]|nr:DMT family transporter [Acidiferrobacterales bacterium]